LFARVLAASALSFLSVSVIVLVLVSAVSLLEGVFVIASLQPFF
jgi:hypothetical protein